MKKLMILLLATLMMLSVVLSSCGDSSDVSDSSEPVSASEKTDDEGISDDSSDKQDTDDAQSSDEDAESDEDSKSEENPKEEESKPEEESLPEEEPLIEGSVEVLYCSYTEKPFFAMVGKCADNAVVTAEIDGETYSSNSYKGWFSLRLPCEGKSVTVTLTQTVDGNAYDVPRHYIAKPKTPGKDMWPVVAGGDFQFFFQKMLPDYEMTNLKSDNIYSSLTSRIEGRLDTIHSYNPDAEIIYLLVPSAMSVYPELVPEEYQQGIGLSNLDKVVQAINDAGATAIDLKKIFAEHKNDEMPLYYKLDSHWADYGAYVAYDALFDHIAKKFPDAAPRSVDEFDWNPDYYQSGDMTYYMAMSQTKVLEYAYNRTFAFDAPSKITNIPRYRSKNMLCYSDNVTWEHTIKTDRSNLPSCMVLRDSYSTQIFDLIPERMDTTHYLGMWNYTWDNSAIKREKPDYIIYVVAEWNLDSILYG